jgi:hypothetical protein
MNSLRQKALLCLLAVLPVVGLAGYWTLKSLQEPTQEALADDAYQEVDWLTLRELDLATGKMPEALAKLDGKPVKVPGFVVPLEDDDQGLAEFLLVPSPQACIHVPPPPPNQMVMVHMSSGQAPKRSWGPVWIKGRLYISTADSQYGKSSYKIRGDSAEKYERANSGG